MGKYWSKQDNRNQKKVSYSLGDESVFIQVLFEQEHARGIHLSFLLAFSSCSDLYVSLGVQGEMEVEIPELLLL